MKSITHLCQLTRPALAQRPWAAATCFALALGALVHTSRETKSLAAGIGIALPVAIDYDKDGLEDVQEYVLGTNPDLNDTDSDGFEDMEEIARGSDPLDPDSIPDEAELGIGLYAYVENGIVSFHAAVYAKGGNTSGLRPEIGMVFGNGQRFPFTAGFVGTGVLLSQTTNDPSDNLLAITLPIQESFIAQMGQMNLYGRIRDVGSSGRQPASTGTTLVNSGGATLMVQTSPSNVGAGQGIIYRPLTGPTVAPPSSAVVGQICHQEVVPVSSEGNLLQYEVQSAGCEDFDSYCQGTGCAGGIGGGIELVDPGALLGG